MQLDTVEYTAADGVARITMNRPDKRNALNHGLSRRPGRGVPGGGEGPVGAARS
ncbi:MAG: hypothetical protein U5Q44_00540 [Dehalococcoidia bacterium]|nr:hypothetical protein [Dehalococcoidia bacterium]